MGVLARIVHAIFSLIELIIVFDLAFAVFHASHGTPFVDLIHRIASVLVAPFTGIFPTLHLGGTSVSWGAIVALFVYGIIQSLLGFILRPNLFRRHY